jgi:outer membrane protein assembly factor BamB
MVGWHDAVAWCNALSELEGRTPCYYADAGLAKPYRTAHRWRIAMCGKDLVNSLRDEVFVRWDADGYRLPTHAEWSAAYRAGDAARLPNDGFPAGAPAKDAAARGWFADASGGATHAVGTRPANAYGIHDLDGNVMEWSWDNPATDPLRVRNPKGARNGLFGMPLLGGCFAGEPVGIGPRAFIQEQESAARPVAGFRVVRCAAGAHGVADDQLPIVLKVDPAAYDPLTGRTFRGGLARTGDYPVSGLPALGGVRWTFATKGPVRSSPVVADGVLVVGSDDGHVYALDPATGAERWRFATGAPVQASATIAGGRVFIGSQSGWLHALDLATGKEAWKWANEPAQPKLFPLTNGTALAYGVLFIGCNGFAQRSNLVGLDPATGKEVWRCRAAKPNDGPMAPTVVGGRIVFPGNDNVLFCVDLATTDLVWRGNGNHCHASVPATADGLWYDAAANCFRMDAGNGKILDRSASAKGGGLSYFPHASPAVRGDIGVFAKQDGFLRAFRVKEFAKPLWEVHLGAQLNSSPALAGGTVYVGSDDGHLYAVDLAGGAVRWKHRTGGPILSSPLPGDGCVWVGSDDGNVICLK